MANKRAAPGPERIFGQRLRRERDRRGWRQEDLAAFMAAHGLSMYYTTYAKIETGTRAVRLHEAVTISAALGIPLSQMTSDAAPEELAAQLERVQAELDKTEAEAEEAIRWTMQLQNRRRDLIAAIAAAGGDLPSASSKTDG